MKPIILTTAGIEDTDRGLVQMYCYKTYSEAIANAGGLPLIAGDDSDPEHMADIADGLYLTGGDDIEAKWYDGIQELCVDRDPWRDQFEMALIRAFIERKKPIFGICRGMQLLNIVLGGNLIEDIADLTGRTHPFNVSHPICTKEGSVLRKLYGETFFVNSFHHQCVGRLGSGFEIVGETNDHIVEAIEHQTLPIIAVQWHPERMTGDHRYNPEGPDMNLLFEHFVHACGGN